MSRPTGSRNSFSSKRMLEVLTERDALALEVKRLREVLDKIANLPLYGNDCTCSEDCSCGEKACKDIAKAALLGGA